jgi:hypothetical protein
VGVVLEAEHMSFARRAEIRGQNRDLCTARPGSQRRPYPPGVPGPDYKEIP